MVRSSLSLLFSRLNNPSYLSHSSQNFCSRPLTFSLPFSRLTPVLQCLSCSEEPRTEHRTWGVVSPVSSTGGPGPAGHGIAHTGQDSIGLFGHLCTHWLMFSHCHQHPQVLFCWAAFQTLPRDCSVTGGVMTHVQDSANPIYRHVFGVPTLCRKDGMLVRWEGCFLLAAQHNSCLPCFLHNVQNLLWRHYPWLP